MAAGLAGATVLGVGSAARAGTGVPAAVAASATTATPEPLDPERADAVAERCEGAADRADAQADTEADGSGAAGADGSAAVAVPIVGRAALQSNTLGIGLLPGVLLVHGVQRVPDGTAVYYSTGYDCSFDGTAAWGGLSAGSARVNASRWSDVAAVDVTGGHVYRSLTTADGDHAVASEERDDETDAGVMYVHYAVLPELPAGLDTVTLMVGGVFLQDVPVGTGALAPTVSTDAAIPLGTGWPALDLDAVADAADPDADVLPLYLTAVDGDDVASGSEDVLVVTMDADRFFTSAEPTTFTADEVDFDAGTLLGDALDRLVTAAADTGGTVTVGYAMEDTGSTTEDFDTASARAQVTKTALQDQLPDGLDLEWATTVYRPGDPVDGQAPPIRMRITFVPAQEQE